jgi:hypothetical protein
MFVQTLVTLKPLTLTVLTKKTVVVDALQGNGYRTSSRPRPMPFSNQAAIAEAERVLADNQEEQSSAVNTSAKRAGRSVCLVGYLSLRFSTARWVGGVVSGGRGHSPLATMSCAGWAKPATRTPPVATRGQIS